MLALRIVPPRLPCRCCLDPVWAGNALRVRPDKVSRLDQQEAGLAIFHPIKPKRAFDEISSEIKRLIFKGTLKPGDRLPSETELANQFGVGRQTIREALRLLELSGFISMQKGGTKGPLVVDTILNSIGNSFLDAFQMKRIRVDELTMARLEIEKMVLKAACANATEGDIKALRENLASARKAIEGNEQQAFEDNIQFHKLLARASHNHVFVIVMESITTVVGHFRSLLGLDSELSRRVLHEHERIVVAMEARDVGKALSILERHILDVGEGFKRVANRELFDFII
jgi:GntR family transcriptional regulator, transcriptional repressor for pyruvate dehydrogenase complex